MSFEPGETVGDYQIRGLLGAGGMGNVYRVRNLITDREEALKVLLPDLTAQAELADRFAREIRIHASLEHPNIAQLRTALRVNNQLIMIMELVPGETVEQRIARGPVDPAFAAAVAAQTLAALRYAHERGIIHRDIKPANIMLTPAGIVKVMDFGIAAGGLARRLTRTGLAVGSLSYMSPEQIRALPLDPRSDIYSLGVTLYEMLAARRPFEGASDFELMKAHLEKQAPPVSAANPSVPPAFAAAISRALAKRPEDRFQSAAEFAEAIEALRPFLAPAPEARPAQGDDQDMQAWDSIIFHEQRAPAGPVSGSGAARSGAAVVPPAPSRPRTPTSGYTDPAGWDPTALEQVRTDLAGYVGPVARLLVSRAAKKTHGLRQLYEALADEIPSPEDRRKFLSKRPLF
jgi:serine/threonine-protein kinase